ncbi:MAG: hypothetical protein ACM3O7_08550 [Acidobacteriota bacterium]
MATVEPQVLLITIVNVGLAAVTVLCIAVVAWAVLVDLCRRASIGPGGGARDGHSGADLLRFPAIGHEAVQAHSRRATSQLPKARTR